MIRHLAVDMSGCPGWVQRLICQLLSALGGVGAYQNDYYLTYSVLLKVLKTIDSQPYP